MVAKLSEVQSRTQELRMRDTEPDEPEVTMDQA